MRFIIDESLEVIDAKIAADPDNEWLLNVREEWEGELLNQGHNLRDLQLDTLIKDEKSQNKIIQILSETRNNILSLGDIVPPLSNRKKLRASNYYNVDRAPTTIYSDIINSIVNLIRNSHN
ncbi:hypothetical protein [Synechococcus sp. PCC 7336]|uniref:hypothetical protein n=1 Tax=Synechococcus sp. PCC 7336 TaxID=195250 RepID=UPI0005712035|nr:hypothetical protein [Synechococcus sp. PCC 7336]